MPAHGPIHLPIEEEEEDIVCSPKVTASLIAFEVVRTAAIAAALGLQVYSATYAKRHPDFRGAEGMVPDRMDIKLWLALGTWQAQAGCAACMVSLDSHICAIWSKS